MNSGPLPKDSASRRRRNASPSMVELPRGGHRGEVPAWPLPVGPSQDVAATWEALWRTPQAAAWVEYGFEYAVARLAVLTVAAASGEATAGVLGEVRQMEDRLGLNPAAMQRLRWKVADPEEGAGELVVLERRDRKVKAVE